MNIVLKINDFFKGTSTIVLLRHDLFSFSRIVLYFSSWSDYFYWNAGGFVKTSWNNSQQYCINIFDTTTHESDTRKENICKKSLALLRFSNFLMSTSSAWLELNRVSTCSRLGLVTPT